MEYQPKGSMCSVCVNKHEDCSSLDFESMNKMTLGYSVTIVKCIDFDKEEENE